MNNVQLLATLQSIDTALDADRRQFAANKEAMNPSSELKQLAAQVKALERQVEALEKERRQRDEEVTAQAAKIKAEETRLYSGTIRDPREQIAVQQHIESMKRYLATLEERALESLMRLEEHQTRLAQIRSRFEEEKAAWVERRAQLEKEQEALVAHARQLKAKRETVLSHIDPKDLAWYEKKRQKLGVVVVPLQGRTCGGCGASLPTSVVQRVQAGERVTCPACGRLLVH